MNRGYVKLWRKSVDSGMLQNHKLWVFWSWCLMKASHKNCNHLVGFQDVKLQPGQFVFGRKSAAIELAMSEQSIRTCLNILKKMENLTIKSTNKFSVITIINWGAYQQDQQTNNHQGNQQATSKQPASNHKQECKECKNVKNKKTIVEKFTPPKLDDVEKYFFENGYTKNSGKKAFQYYDCADWKDSRGQPVKNWKQKMRGVWFKPENEQKGGVNKNGSINNYTGEDNRQPIIPTRTPTYE